MARSAVRRPDHKGQPCRQGRQGRPAVQFRRAHGDRRRRRHRRTGVRKGQGGRAWPSKRGSRRPRRASSRVPLAGSTITHPVLGEAGAGPGAAQAGRPGYRRDSRRGGAADPRDGRHPRHTGQVSRVVQQHQCGPGDHGRAAGAHAPRRDSPPARQVRRGGHSQRRLAGLQRNPTGTARAHGGRVMAEAPHQRQAGQVGHREHAQAPGYPACARARRDRPDGGPAGPSRDPWHGGPGDPPRRGRRRMKEQYRSRPHDVKGQLMKVHDLQARSGVVPAAPARRARHRRKGWQDRGPRHQGGQGPRAT